MSEYTHLQTIDAKELARDIPRMYCNDMNSAAITAVEAATAALLAAGPHATNAEKAPLRAAVVAAAALLTPAEKAYMHAAMKAKIAAREGAR